VDRAHGRAEELLDEYRETASERGFEVETLLATGKPARQILDAVESEGVDHVVMGSRGRSGLGRVLFGSVAEAVTRRAPVPVTIIR
jgi:nucleotide-binding universal stress UspA family protein